MRGAGIACCLALAGCASGTPLSSQTEQTMRASGGGGTGGLNIRAGEGAHVTQMSFPLARIWSVLPAVYDSLGIALSEVDDANHMVGASGLKLHKKLGNIALGKLIDCGNAQGFPSADAYDIRMAVHTQLQARDDGSTSIGTLVEAVGKPLAVAGDFVRCTTREDLEKRIVEAIRARLGQ